MLTFARRLLVVIACAGIGAGWSAWAGLSALGRVETEDRNRDGRPDVWRFFDAHGTLTLVTIDTNFDGRPDQEEQYDHGALTRRRSDRNFDRRVDLTEDFDPITHLPVRSIVDVDFDGRADLLVLFQDGIPVHSEWATTRAPLETSLAGSREGPSDPDSRTELLTLADPFAAATAFGAVRSSVGSGPVLVTAAAVAFQVTTLIESPLPPEATTSSLIAARLSVFRSAGAPRAPPSSLLT